MISAKSPKGNTAFILQIKQCSWSHVSLEDHLFSNQKKFQLPSFISNFLFVCFYPFVITLHDEFMIIMVAPTSLNKSIISLWGCKWVIQLSEILGGLIRTEQVAPLLATGHEMRSFPQWLCFSERSWDQENKKYSS